MPDKAITIQSDTTPLIPEQPVFKNLRFETDQCWNFGITPSEYAVQQVPHLLLSKPKRQLLENMDWEISNKMNHCENKLNGDDTYVYTLERGVSLHELDELYNLTTKVGPLESNLHPKWSRLLECTLSDWDKYYCSLALQKAKPAGIVTFQTTPPITEGVYTHPFKFVKAYIGDQTIESYDYYVSREKKVIEAIAVYQERAIELLKTDSRIATKTIDLVQGIMLGFPIGDVMETNPYSTYEKSRGDFPLLCHSVKAHLWAPSYRETVGMHGEEHLQKVYGLCTAKEFLSQ